MQKTYKRWTMRATATETRRPSDFDNDNNTMWQWC